MEVTCGNGDGTQYSRELQRVGLLGPYRWLYVTALHDTQNYGQKIIICNLEDARSITEVSGPKTLLIGSGSEDCMVTADRPWLYRADWPSWRNQWSVIVRGREAV